MSGAAAGGGGAGVCSNEGGWKGLGGEEETHFKFPQNFLASSLFRFVNNREKNSTEGSNKI